MQIHAGRYKGRRIKTVANVSYRPTMALVRKSLFDILGDLTGYHVLDLFSGTGIFSSGVTNVFGSFAKISVKFSSLATAISKSFAPANNASSNPK